jgi:hypothetical protein
MNSIKKFNRYIFFLFFIGYFFGSVNAIAWTIPYKKINNAILYGAGAYIMIASGYRVFKNIKNFLKASDEQLETTVNNAVSYAPDDLWHIILKTIQIVLLDANNKAGNDYKKTVKTARYKCFLRPAAGWFAVGAVTGGTMLYAYKKY